MAGKSNTKFVGVDDGHWGIKVVTEKLQLLIPSRAAEGRQLVGLHSADSESYYVTPEGPYTVHEHLQHPADTRFKDYPRSPLNRVLVHHALRKADLGGVNVNICTGLPVAYYFNHEGLADQGLIDAKRANLKKEISCAAELAIIKQNNVASEAIAAFVDQLMDMSGEETELHDELINSTVGIIDVGGKTTDCAVVLPGGNQVDRERSGSADVGLLQLNDAVRSRLLAKHDLHNISSRKVEDCITTGVIKLDGQEYDESALVLSEKEALAKRVAAAVRPKINNGRDLDFLFFVGGGALVLAQQLKAFYPHGVVARDPEFANARGMYKMAKFFFNEDE